MCVCKTYATHSHVHKATRNMHETKTKAKAKIKSNNNNSKKVKKIKNDDFRLLFACCLCPPPSPLPSLLPCSAFISFAVLVAKRRRRRRRSLHECVCVREGEQFERRFIVVKFCNFSFISICFVSFRFGFPLYLSMFVFLLLLRYF